MFHDFGPMWHHKGKFFVVVIGLFVFLFAIVGIRNLFKIQVGSNWMMGLLILDPTHFRIQPDPLIWCERATGYGKGQWPVKKRRNSFCSWDNLPQRGRKRKVQGRWSTFLHDNFTNCSQLAVISDVKTFTLQIFSVNALLQSHLQAKVRDGTALSRLGLDCLAIGIWAKGDTWKENGIWFYFNCLIYLFPKIQHMGWTAWHC